MSSVQLVVSLLHIALSTDALETAFLHIQKRRMRDR